MTNLKAPNAVGVAVTGVIFGAVRHGYPRALELSLIQLGCLLLAVAALSRLMPTVRGVVPARRS